MKKIKLSNSIKNVTKVSLGTVIGQIVSIVTLPIITRLYSSEIIGIWTTINSFSIISLYVCDLGLTNVLMMSDDSKLQYLYSIITKICIVLCIIISICLFGYNILSNGDIKYSLMICCFVGVYTFLLAYENICSTILTRKEEYTVLMKNSAIRFISAALISIGLGLIGFKSLGYYIGNVFGIFFTIGNMIRFMPKVIKIESIKCYILTIKENINYLKYQMPSSISVNLRTELPNLLIGGLFGNEILGYYSISQKLLTIPITFLGQSLGKVFYQSIAKMKRSGQDIAAYFNKNLNRGMIVALIPMIFLAAYGDVAITMFFGKEYSIGGVISRIVVYRSLFNFISTATRGLDIVLDKQHYVLYSCVSQTILAIMSVLVGYYVFDSIYAAVIILVASFIVVQIIYFSKMYIALNLNYKQYLLRTFTIIAILFIGSSLLRYSTIYILQLGDFEIFKHILNYFIM